MIKKSSSVKEVLENQQECKICGSCCNFGSGIIVKEEVKKIAKFLGISEKELKEKYLEGVRLYNKDMMRPKFEKPFGKCVFLEDKKCGIHEVKPLHCMVACCGEKGEQNDQWFKLNHIVDEKDKVSMEEWKEFEKRNMVLRN